MTATRILLPACIILAALIGGIGLILAAIVILVDVAHTNGWSVTKFATWSLLLIFAWLVLVVVAA